MLLQNTHLDGLSFKPDTLMCQPQDRDGTIRRYTKEHKEYSLQIYKYIANPKSGHSYNIKITANSKMLSIANRYKLEQNMFI